MNTMSTLRIPMIIVHGRMQMTYTVGLTHKTLIRLAYLFPDCRYLQACTIVFLNDVSTCFHGCRIIVHGALSLACPSLVEKPLTRPKLVYETVTLAPLNSRWYAPSRFLRWFRGRLNSYVTDLPSRIHKRDQLC